MSYVLATLPYLGLEVVLWLCVSSVCLEGASETPCVMTHTLHTTDYSNRGCGGRGPTHGVGNPTQAGNDILKLSAFHPP